MESLYAYLELPVSCRAKLCGSYFAYIGNCTGWSGTQIRNSFKVCASTWFQIKHSGGSLGLKKALEVDAKYRELCREHTNLQLSFTEFLQRAAGSVIEAEKLEVYTK